MFASLLSKRAWALIFEIARTAKRRLFALIKHDFHILSLDALPQTFHNMDRDGGCYRVLSAHCFARHDRSKTASSALVHINTAAGVYCLRVGSIRMRTLPDRKVYLGVQVWLLPVH